MEVEIPLDLREYVEFLVNAGRYSSPSEVLVAALKALNEKESTIPLSDGELIAMYPNINELIAEGLAEADAGKCTDGEEFFAELERRTVAGNYSRSEDRLNMRYVLTPAAKNDVREILQYIRNDDPRAEKVVRQSLMEGVRKLAAFPNRGHRHREVTIPNVLVYRVSSYLIAYEQETNPLRILRVVHGTRDLKRLFRKP